MNTTINSYSHAEDQCLNLPASESVSCSSQHLNITNPPSIYSYDAYTPLWEPISCLLWNITLERRVDVEGETLSRSCKFDLSQRQLCGAKRISL